MKKMEGFVKKNQVEGIVKKLKQKNKTEGRVIKQK